MIEKLYPGDVFHLELRQEARRIQDKAFGTDDPKERNRLLLIAECLWPSDPVTRVVDWMTEPPPSRATLDEPGKPN